MKEVRDALYGFAFFTAILVVGAVEGAQDETAIPVITITLLLTTCFILGAELMRLKINFKNYQLGSIERQRYVIKKPYRRAYNQEKDL